MFGLLIGLACAAFAMLAGLTGAMIGLSMALLCLLIPLSPFFLILLAIVWLVKRSQPANGGRAGA